MSATVTDAKGVQRGDLARVYDRLRKRSLRKRDRRLAMLHVGAPWTGPEGFQPGATPGVFVMRRSPGTYFTLSENIKVKHMDYLDGVRDALNAIEPVVFYLEDEIAAAYDLGFSDARFVGGVL